jgi:dUTP pyrophosphatase
MSLSDTPSDLELRVKRLDPKAKLPVRATPGAIGYDLASIEEVTVLPQSRTSVCTGLAVAVPPEHYGRIAPRSGLAARNGIDVLAGVIDADYRGELIVILHNTSLSDALVLPQGTKVAQLILERASTPPVREVVELDDTIRGSGGFGSTDNK